MPENVYIHELSLGVIEAKVLKKLWIQFDENTDGTAPDEAFIKYTRTRIRDAINEAYSYISGFGKMIQSWFIIPTKANYGQYPIPINVVDIDRVFYFTSATDYDELEMLDRAVLDELLPGWRTEQGPPEYAYPGDWSRTNRRLGISPIPTIDATSVTLDSAVLNRPTPYGVLEAVNGSANPDSGANYVDSSGQNFYNLGVIVGMIILNITDGSKGTITSITTTNTSYDTIVCSGGLSGGSMNTWTPGDEMRIIGGDYGGYYQIAQTEAQFLLSPTAGQLPRPGVTMASGNLLVECSILPTLLTYKYQYPEIHPLFHPGIVIGAAAILAEEEPIDSPEFAKSADYRKRFEGYASSGSKFMAEHFKSSGDQRLWSRNS